MEKPAGGEYPPVTDGIEVPLALLAPAFTDGYPPEVLPTLAEVWKPLGENPPGNPVTTVLGTGGLGLVDEGKDDGGRGGR